LLAAAAISSPASDRSNKPEFSLSIRTSEVEAKAGDRIEIQVTKTNLSHTTLAVGGNRVFPYIFEVRREGVLVPETSSAKNIHEHPTPGPMIDGNLAPHSYALDTIVVNEYRDMSQPGVYTILVREGNVKSNKITVTVTE